MAALCNTSLRGLHRSAGILSHKGRQFHQSGCSTLLVDSASPPRQLERWTLPSGLLFAAASWTGLTFKDPACCDASAELGQDAKTVEVLVKLRSVMAKLKCSTNLNSDNFIKAGRTAYQSAVGADGRLSQEGLERMLANSMAQKGSSWGQQSSPSEHAAAASELAPILLQLLDADGDGNVTEKEFVMGHMLMFAAAKAHSPEVLMDLCWRAMDADNSGTISHDELETAVRMMARVNAVRREDRKEVFAGMRRSGHGPKRQFTRERSVDNLVNYYMDMYDVNRDGSISKEEFCQFSALQENFLMLLTSPEFDSLMQH